MPKVRKTTVVVKCQCSVCGQVAFVEEGGQHFHCRGIKLVKPLPSMFSHLCKSDNKGTWLRYVETPLPAKPLPEPLPPVLDPAMVQALA